MFENFFINNDTFAWVILPLFIFISRIIDVTIGTIRIVFVARGKKFISPLLGFFEIFVWVNAIGQIMQHLNSMMCYVAYAGGFAAGNYFGLLIEEKLAIGILVVRIFLKEDPEELKERLRAAGYGVTVFNAQGRDGEVKLLYTVIKRKNLDSVVSIINHYNPSVFYSIEDTKMVNKGVFPKINRRKYNINRQLKLRRVMTKKFIKKVIRRNKG